MDRTSSNAPCFSQVFRMRTRPASSTIWASTTPGPNSEIRDGDVAIEHCIDRLAIAVRAERLGPSRNTHGRC